MTKIKSGAAVTTIDDPTNVKDKTALPVAVVTGKKVKAGSSQPVYEVSQSELDTGIFKLKAGAATPVVSVTNRNVMAGKSQPVFIVSGGDAPPSFDITYLLDDQFLTDESAPITSPRTTEPGGQIVNLNDTAPIMSIAGGEMIPSAVSTGVNNPKYISDSSFVRTPALCLKATIKRVSSFGGSENNVAISWADTTGTGYANAEVGFAFNTGTFIQLRWSGMLITQLTTGFLSDVYHTFYLICKENGGNYLVANGRLIWVDYLQNATPLFAQVTSFQANRMSWASDEFKVAQMNNGNWLTEFGVASDVLPGPLGTPQNFSATADCLINITIDTVPVSRDINFRYLDASNFIRCRLETNTDITLTEIVAGVETNIGTAVSIFGAGDIVRIRADGSTIKVFVNNVLEITATSTVQQTTSGGRYELNGTGGQVNDLISWPIALTGNDLAILEAI